MTADATRGAIRWSELGSTTLTPSVSGQSVSGRQLSAARFELAPGAEVPPHAHPSEEFGHVLAGAVTVAWLDQEVTVRSGESFLIPGDTTHRATALDEGCTLLECYSPPRDPTAAAQTEGDGA